MMPSTPQLIDFSGDVSRTMSLRICLWPARTLSGHQGGYLRISVVATKGNYQAGTSAISTTTDNHSTIRSDVAPDFPALYPITRTGCRWATFLHQARKAASASLITMPFSRVVRRQSASME